MRHPVLSRCAAALLVSMSLGLSGLPAQAAAPASTASVAWVTVTGDADMDRQFAQAKAEKKPVLLYWGAKWCPPCNQLKATLFNRADFIEQSKAFVAVGLDGDAPGAQKLGERFKVSGYPTLILFSPAGQEITRLPGEADAPQVIKLLQLGLAGGRPIQAVLADAQGGKKLTANEWRLLAFYSWETDHQQLIAAKDKAAVLARLAKAAEGGDAETALRLTLKALATEGSALKPDAALLARVRAVLASPAQSHAMMDVLVNEAPDLVRNLAPEAGPARQALVADFEPALKRLEMDRSLSRADRLGALMARVELARIDAPKTELNPKLPAALQQESRDAAQRAHREITDGYERQAVVTSAAYLLTRAGLWKDSDELLKAALARSHSPYYLMSQLGGNARKQGQKAEALRWYEEAFNKSEGPATRLQWGAGYFTALVELAPEDATRIEKAASQLFTEAAGDPSAFYERSERSLARVATQLQTWNKDGSKAAVISRLKTQLDGVCGKLDAAETKARAACGKLLKT
ncbi:thioredoxin family protein [Roseateles paludis]|uniref:Thioredoxin fold domain-containing protein n=1 Tax=Roseateles paludis TaxID=3145238 RepID=A0ABV0FZ11_9BURK